MKKMIDLLIFYATYKCNSKCKTCFYWKELNARRNELTIEEIKKISSSIGNFNTLLLGGGEPTLRKDILNIAELFYKKNHARDISVPTNCILADNVFEITEGLLQRCPKAVINIGLSLDGVGKIHDDIRGVKGNFKKVVEVEKRLRELSRRNKNLIVKILTTITKENYDNLPKLMRFVRENMRIRYHYFEPLRGNPRDKKQLGITYGQLRSLNKKILKNYTYYYKNKIRMVYDIYNIRQHQKNAEQFFKNGTMKIGCTAGTSAAVIEANGDVRLCELLKKVGSLRKVNYDFRKIWYGKEARKQRKFIKDKKCACTHCVFLEKSLLAKFIEGIQWK